MFAFNMLLIINLLDIAGKYQQLRNRNIYENQHGKSPKISYTKVPYKLHIQTVLTQIRLGAIWSGSTLFAISTNYFKKQVH